MVRETTEWGGSSFQNRISTLFLKGHYMAYSKIVVVHSGSWPRTVRIPNPCFLYPSVSSDLCAASVEYKSFSVRLIFTGRKEACVSKLKFLGAGTNPFWYWDLEHTLKGLLTQLLAQPLPKPVGQLSSTWNSSRGLQLPYQGNLKLAQFNLSGWELQ